MRTSPLFTRSWMLMIAGRPGAYACACIYRSPLAVPSRPALGLLEELQVAPRQCSLQATDIGVPFCLHRFHRANDLLESVQPPTPLHQRQGAFPMLRRLEHEKRYRPPVEVIQVELATHGRAAVVGNDAAQGDHAAVAEVLRQAGARRDLIHPPDRVRMG